MTRYIIQKYNARERVHRYTQIRIKNNNDTVYSVAKQKLYEMTSNIN